MGTAFKPSRDRELLGALRGLFDPAERYFRRTQSEESIRTPAQVSELPGRWLDWSRPHALDEATSTLLADGAVRVRLPNGAVAAILLRFWTGSAVLDIHRIGIDRSGRSRTRLRQQPTGSLAWVLHTVPLQPDSLDVEVRRRLSEAISRTLTPPS